MNILFYFVLTMSATFLATILISVLLAIFKAIFKVYISSEFTLISIFFLSLLANTILAYVVLEKTIFVAFTLAISGTLLLPIMLLIAGSSIVVILLMLEYDPEKNVEKEVLK